MSKVLVFSVALNGYQWRYKTLIGSHQSYAIKHGYEYVCVSRPSFCLLGMEVAWLKIKLIIQALDAGYDTILFLDADTRISQDSPAIETTFRDEKVIYAANGFSNRINSGVLVIRQSIEAKKFFEKTLASALSTLPPEDDVGWGENGHIIHQAKFTNNIGQLDKRWNNNSQVDLRDYVRHFSRGPLHQEFTPPFGHTLMAHLYHYGLALAKRAARLYRSVTRNHVSEYHFFESLERLSNQVSLHYPEVFPTS